MPSSRHLAVAMIALFFQLPLVPASQNILCNLYPPVAHHSGSQPDFIIKHAYGEVNFYCGLKRYIS